MRCKDKLEREGLSTFHFKISKEASKKPNLIKFSKIGSKSKKGEEKQLFWELTQTIPSLISRIKTSIRNSKIKMEIKMPNKKTLNRKKR